MKGGISDQATKSFFIIHLFILLGWGVDTMTRMQRSQDNWGSHISPSTMNPRDLTQIDHQAWQQRPLPTAFTYQAICDGLSDKGPISSHVWQLGLHLVELFGKD